jgi:hypothetical protein
LPGLAIGNEVPLQPLEVRLQRSGIGIANGLEGNVDRSLAEFALELAHQDAGFIRQRTLTIVYRAPRALLVAAQYRQYLVALVDVSLQLVSDGGADSPTSQVPRY